MTTPETVLAQVPLFSMLSKKELVNLMRNAHDRSFPGGAVLTDEDETGVTFGVIVESGDRDRTRKGGAHSRPR